MSQVLLCDPARFRNCDSGVSRERTGRRVRAEVSGSWAKSERPVGQWSLSHRSLWCEGEEDERAGMRPQIP